MFIQPLLYGGGASETEQLICGIDEVGRGCLAGPVVACAVILSATVDGLTDSKKLSAKKREALAGLVTQRAVSYGIGVVGQKTIDRINILQATFQAMAIAVARLTRSPSLLLVDGRFVIPPAILARFLGQHGIRTLPTQRAIIRGDASEPAISAASVVAKTYRDALMHKMAEKWPEYGFNKHVGYGTRFHLQQLARFGPCPLHRRTFRGVLPRETESSDKSER